MPSIVKTDKIFSFLLVVLMMVAAAIATNRTLFGKSLERTVASASAPADTITRLANGSLVIHTASLPGTINGYGGPVPLDITLSDGRVSSVTALPNAETAAFFKRAEPLLESWNGKTPEEALKVQVDAVSGATYSSNAIIANVRQGLDFYQGVDEKENAPVPLKIWIAFAVTLAACVVPLFVHDKKYHTVQLIANVLVLGFWSGQFLDYTLMLKYLSQGFAWPAGVIAVMMLAAAFLYPLFGHPQHYCTHICPLGSAQQLAAQWCGYKVHLSKKTLHALEWFRRILWGVLMLSLWTDVLVEWMDFELFQAFIVESAPWWIITLAGLFIALSTIVSRPYCRFVCPTGSLFKRSENMG